MPVILSGGVTSTVKVKPYNGTNIGGWVFDAFLRINHTSELEITKHPVQTGANITDHSFLQPKTIEFEIGMTDVMQQSKYQAQFDSGSSRSVTAHKILSQLQSDRIPLQVTTRLGIYENMLVKSIHEPDDYTTKFGLKATVVMQEVIFASVSTYKISSDPQKTDSTNRGTVTTSPAYQAGYNFGSKLNPSAAISNFINKAHVPTQDYVNAATHGI